MFSISDREETFAKLSTVIVVFHHAVLPQPPRSGTLPRGRCSPGPNNILTRGQTITESIDEDHAIALVLEPGECSLQHVNLFRASHQNQVDQRRVGLTLRYVTPGAKQQQVATDFVTLVRGNDPFEHFELEPPPQGEMSPQAVALHERIGNIQGQSYLDGTDRAGIDRLRETNTS